MRLALPHDAFSRLLLGVLLFVSLFALLPWQPQGPFDARDWSHIAGVSVTMPWWQLLLEPFSALGHIITGAPDFRLAAYAITAWVVVLSWLWVVLRYRHLAWWRRALWASAVALFGLWCIPAMMLFFSHLHFPGWQLQLDDPQWLAADLQSHTLGSHDALVSADYNLQWHSERGYDVVGITEHDDPAGSFFAQQLARQQGGPLVIPGVEVANEYNGFLLGMGLKPQRPLAMWQKGEPNFSRRFAATVGAQHQGAVISMAWRLAPQDIETLANDGVSAFELINTGHPDIPDAVRAEMLRLEAEGRIRLVSSSDWHGWGGNSRSWTLLHLSGAEQMSATEQAAQIIQLLRDGGRAEVIPVVAGYQGAVSPLRLIFAPLVETARYAAELSPGRLFGWWLWGLLLWLAARQLKSAGIAPGRVLWGAYLLLIALLLLWKGLALHQLSPAGEVVLSDVTKPLGAMAMQAALPLLLVGGWLAAWSWRKRDLGGVTE